MHDLLHSDTEDLRPPPPTRPVKMHFCPVPGCTSSFAKLYNLQRHIKSTFHKGSGIPLENIETVPDESEEHIRYMELGEVESHQMDNPYSMTCTWWQASSVHVFWICFSRALMRFPHSACVVRIVVWDQVYRKILTRRMSVKSAVLPITSLTMSKFFYLLLRIGPLC